MQRQLEPIWDAIDSEQFGYALQLIEKTQKRYRTSDLTLLSLQGLCLSKESRVTEAIEICEKIRLDAPGNKDTYQNIHDILKASPGEQVNRYLVETIEAGFRSIKTEFMGRLWFMESARTGNLLAQRKAAVELQKGFLSRHYFYLVLVSMRLLYRQGIETKENTLLGLLMYRMISKAADNISDDRGVEGSTNGPKIDTIEEFYLYLDILQLMGKDSESISALNGPHGKKYSGSHDLLLLHLNLLSKTNAHEARFKLAETSLRAGVNDWLVWKALVDSGKVINNHSTDQVRALLDDLTENKNCRNTILARIYLQSGVEHANNALESLKQYIEAYHDKLTTFEDLAPYAKLLDDKRKETFLRQFQETKSATSIGNIISFTTSIKFEILLNHKNMQADALMDLVPRLLRQYTGALEFGSDLKATDNQYGDDLVSIAGRILHNESDIIPQSSLSAIVILEYALTHSKHNYQLKLFLVSLYRTLGAWSIAHTLYKTLHIKHVQHDTLSYMLLEQAPYEYCSTMQITSLAESQYIYRSNQTETADAICQAYEHKTYSKIPEFLGFQKRLDQSIWRFESQINIWSLEILLDKFEHKSLVTLKNLDQEIYDNKSRHVMLNIFDLPTDQETTHHASAEDVERLKRGYRKIQMYQAVVRNESLPDDELLDATSTKDNVYEFVRALYNLKFASSKDGQISTFLASVVQIKVPTLENAQGLTSATLHEYGQVVEVLKMYAVMSSHIKADLKPIKNHLQNLLKQIKSSLEKLRADTVHCELSMRPLEEINLENKFVQSIFEKVKNGRRESVTCLLSIVKSIKI